MIFAKECKRTVRSVVYLIYCIVLAMFFWTQYFSCMGQPLYEPQPDWVEFGTKIGNDPVTIMNGAVSELYGEYTANRYNCYPYGFIKTVHLKQKDQERMKEYLMEILGVDEEGMEELFQNSKARFLDDGFTTYTALTAELKATDGFSYQRFQESCAQVDQLLGGGSNYEPEMLAPKYCRVPMTYEDAMAEYREFTQEDRVTQALARLFCDYMGIFVSLLPVFVAAAFTDSDRRNRISDLIYVRKAGSVRIVFARYAALTTMTFLPVLVMMGMSFVQALVNYGGIAMDYGAFFTLPVIWLLPGIMIATAVGMFLTELVSPGAAILVQLLWWFGLFMQGGRLVGGIKMFSLVVRHNAIGERAAFMECFHTFLMNRIFFAAVALGLVLLTAMLFEIKRGGKWNGIRLSGKSDRFGRKA